MSDSILETIKPAVGVDPSYDVFDAEIKMHINTTFSVLHQLGVGPEKPFFITDKSQTWEEFLDADPGSMEAVKTYIQMSVKLLFDPPTTSFALDNMGKVVAELGWRLNVSSEGAKRDSASTGP